MLNPKSGIYRLRLPLPFRLNHVNTYLIRGEEGWWIIDTGFNSIKTKQCWHRFMEEHDIHYKDIRGIFLTHFHPDHVGCAPWLQNLTNAPIYVSQEDAHIVEKLFRPDNDHSQKVYRLFCENGVPRNLADQILMMDGNLGTPQEFPPKLTIIRPNDEIQLGNYIYRAIWTPGHSDGHLCLYNVKLGIFFSGDHVLPDITSNIGYWPDANPNPLDRYLNSLDTIQDLQCHTILPAHGEIFYDLPTRVTELRNHHQERLHKIYNYVQGNTAYEICGNIFGRELSLEDLRLAMAETLAHLHFLLSQEEVKRVKDETSTTLIYRYYKITESLS